MSESDRSDNGGMLWSQPRHSVAYREARAVLNAQQQRQNNLDDKALRTARLTTIVVGSIITAAKAFDIAVMEPLGYAGICLLVVSFGTALASFGMSSPILGPGSEGLRELVREGDVWERTFLAQLEAAVAINTSQLNRCSFLLLVSDGTLFAGVIASLSAVAL